MDDLATGCDTIGRLLCQGGDVLRRASIPDPGRDARLLLSHSLGLEPAALLARRHEAVAAAPYHALLARRASREPMALITGRQGFWTLDLLVSPASLIPRADSETLIEAALRMRPDRRSVRRVLDLGTGTGCLLLAALSEYPAACGIGVDLAPDAAALAARNAAEHGLSGRASFLAGCWADALRCEFDLILCNPPYIPAADIAGLQPEVRAHEPRRALDGGADGLHAYRQIAAALPGLMTQDGLAVLELGFGQAPAVSALAAARGLESLATQDDLAGIPRALVLHQPACRS